VFVFRQLGDNSDWWAELLQSVTYAQLDSQLVSRVKEDLLDNVTPDKINTAHKSVYIISQFQLHSNYVSSRRS